MRGDTRRPTVQNASTGQRMIVSPLQCPAKESQDTKDLCIPEQVADLGVDDFDCITTDTSGSASEEVGASG